MTEEQKKPRVFCCDKCRVKWWHSKRKYCSHECYVRNRFKGGDGGG